MWWTIYTPITMTQAALAAKGRTQHPRGSYTRPREWVEGYGAVNRLVHSKQATSLYLRCLSDGAMIPTRDTIQAQSRRGLRQLRDHYFRILVLQATVNYR
jgi:hypothetical protein